MAVLPLSLLTRVSGGINQTIYEVLASTIRTFGFPEDPALWPLNVRIETVAPILYKVRSFAPGGESLGGVLYQTSTYSVSLRVLDDSGVIAESEEEPTEGSGLSHLLIRNPSGFLTKLLIRP